MSARSGNATGPQDTLCQVPKVATQVANIKKNSPDPLTPQADALDSKDPDARRGAFRGHETSKTGRSGVDIDGSGR